MDNFQGYASLQTGMGQQGLQNVTTSHTTQQVSLDVMLQNWWSDLSPNMKHHLKDIFDGLVTNIEKVNVGLEYNESLYSPSVLLQCIEKLRRNRVPFNDLLSWLALVAGVHNKEQITAVEMFTSSYVPKPIHGFYIDLLELNALLDE